jgi:hypothetical protein
MGAVLRSAVALILGVVLGFILIAAIEIAGQVIYPFPTDTDPTDMEAVKTAFASAPPLVLVPVFLGWAVGTFAGAALAALLAGRAPVAHGLIIGVLFLLAGIANMLMLPHPLWFWVVGLAVFLPAGYLGGKCASRGKSIATPGTALM